MLAVLLHVLHVLNPQTPAAMVRLPPPFKYKLSDVRVHVSDVACLDVFLTRKGPPKGTRKYLIKSQCFRDGDWDSPEGGNYPYKKMPFEYAIRGSDSIQLDFVTRQPTAHEAAEMAVASGDPSAVWSFAHQNALSIVIVSAWLERIK